MAAVAPMIDSTTFDFDQLTNDIFSILENKFLFNGIDAAGKNEIPVGKLTEELKANENDIGKVRILSIDGLGSTEGILAAKSLSHLEATLRKKSGNSDARIADFFDVAAGSGVGGILIALLFTKGKDGRPMFKADEALQFLVNNRRKLSSSSSLSSSPGVFSRMFRQSSKTEKIFRRVFGESTLKDTVKPVLIPCYDLSTRAPFLFSRADALETDGYDFKMREVCVATSADPTTVGAVEMKSMDRRTRILAVDGGLAMNNPTAAAITHVLNNKQEFPFCDSVEDLLVVSLGNGESDPSGKNPTSRSSTTGFLKIAGEGASETVDQAISMAFGEFRSTNYVRIQANGLMNNNSSSSIAMEGKKLLEVAEKMLKQKNVESVLFRGKKIIEKTNLERLDCFGGELIKEHERRKSSVFPTVMFKQASPRSSSATSSSC